MSREDATAGAPFYLAQNSLAFRQISQTDKLNAFIGGLQWKPTDTLDINIDTQYSKRHYIEDRHDLNLSEPTYDLHNIEYDDQHRLLHAEGITSVEANGNYYERFETYTGIGGNVSWKPADRLTVDADLSYSHTKRSTMQRQTRLRTDPKDIYGDKTPINNQRIPYVYDATGALPTVTFDPRFDPNDWTLLSDDARFRRDDDENRDTIYAARGDVAYEVGMSGPGRLHDLFVTHEAMSPGHYKTRGAGLAIRYGYHISPFGVALIMVTDRGLAGLAFSDPGREREAFADMSARWPNAAYIDDMSATAPYAGRIFDPAKWRSDEPLRVVMIGTDFQLRVWEALLKIPMGRAVSYSAIASGIGAPAASRAVGAAVGANPMSFVVPCHRAVGKSGALTGYHWGLTRKRAILGWEAGQLAGH